MRKGRITADAITSRVAVSLFSNLLQQKPETQKCAERQTVKQKMSLILLSFRHF